jgi:hypothetical protein
VARGGQAARLRAVGSGEAMQPSAADDEIEKILEERLKMAELEIERMGPNSKSPIPLQNAWSRRATG